MRNFRPDKNNVLLYLVLTLSILNFCLQFSGVNTLSKANSIIGLAGVMLFFMNKSYFRYFIWFWIAAQAIIIEKTITDQAGTFLQTDSIFDLSQVFKLKFGFFLKGDKHSIEVNFNIVVLLYFFLFRNLKTSSYLGKKIGLLFTGHDLDLQFAPGTYAMLQNRVNLDGDDNWILGGLSTKIHFHQNEYDRILVHAEDGLLTHTFRLVSTSANLKSGINASRQFEQVNWIMIDLKEM